MAEINEFVSKEALKQQDEYISKLTVIKNNYQEASKEAIKLFDNVEKIHVSGKKTSEIQEKINSNNKKAQEIAKKVNKSTSEAAKIQKQYNAVKERARIANGNYNKALIKERLNLQKTNHEIKKNIIISQSQDGAYNKIAASLSNNIARWKALSAAERENTSAGKTLTNTIRRQEAELKKLDAQIGRHQRNVGNYGSALGGVARNLLGAFGVVGGIAMFAMVLKNAFGTVREFTKENAVLAGVLGTTRDQVSDLTQQAVMLGSQYPVLATDVTKLQVSYARLGFTQSEILNLTEATIQGSIALNSSLDKTATLVGAVVRAFGDLGTQDSSKIIDVLTKATQRSSLSFDGLETALPKVAAAANALGVDLETVTAQLGIAQDATLDASISATSLRNIYLEISKRGLTLDEALSQINNSSNRLSASFELFGKRGAIVGLALADNIEKTSELEQELRNAGGTTESVAKEQMDTLDGSIKSFQSSWEKVVLGFRNSDGAWRAVIDSATQFLDTFSDSRISGWRKFIELSTLGFWDMATEQQQALARISSTITKTNSEQLQNYLEYYRDALLEEGKFGEEKIKIIEDAIKEKQKTEQKDREDKAKRDKNAQTQLELEKLAQQREADEKRKEKQEELDEDLLGLREDLEEEGEKIRQRANENEIKQTEDNIDEYLKLEEDKEKEIEKGIENIEKANEESNKKRIDQTKKRIETEKQLERELADAKEQLLNDSVAAIFDINRAANEEELDALNEEKETLLSNESLTADQRAAIESEFEMKQNEIRNRQKAADKIQSAVDIGISTAKSIFEIKAVAATLASNPITAALAPIALAQIPFVLASSGLALGTIAAFEHGTDNAPRTGIFGEKGSELMQTKGGEFYYADGATLFDGEKYRGAKIWDASQTNEIMNSVGNGLIKGQSIDNVINSALSRKYEKGFDKVATEISKGNNKVVKAIKQNKPTFNRRRNVVTDRHGNTIKKYYDLFS